MHLGRGLVDGREVGELVGRRRMGRLVDGRLVDGRLIYVGHPVLDHISIP